MSKEPCLVHKETFYQGADEGIPSHWVVQYYIYGKGFPEASYFNTEEEAKEFENELVMDGVFNNVS